MFVQIMEGQTSDAAGVDRLMARWRDELRPGASGFLGSTGGVADDGHFVLMARFESADAARANSERPEQGAWWSEMEKCFDGPVEFRESTEVDTFRGGGSDDAGFVQVMKDTGADRGALGSFDEKLETVGRDFRPDVLGGIRIWTSPDAYTEFAYFTSEDDARAGEKLDPPQELAEDLQQFGELMSGVEYLDLRRPMIGS